MNKETQDQINQKLLEEQIKGKQKVSSHPYDDVEDLNDEEPEDATEGSNDDEVDDIGSWEDVLAGFEEDDPDYEPEIVEWNSQEFGKETDVQKQFKKDMLKASYTVQLYRGRYFYRGYAAAIPRDRLQDAIRATAVEVQWDNLGLDWIMYPR